jgi:hypothetical protein
MYWNLRRWVLSPPEDVHFPSETSVSSTPFSRKTAPTKRDTQAERASAAARHEGKPKKTVSVLAVKTALLRLHLDRVFSADAQVRRRSIPHFSLCGRNFIPRFYGVSDIFLRLP